MPRSSKTLTTMSPNPIVSTRIKRLQPLVQPTAAATAPHNNQSHEPQDEIRHEVPHHRLPIVVAEVKPRDGASQGGNNEQLVDARDGEWPRRG